MEKNKKKKGIYSLVHESLDGTKKSYLRMLDDEGKLKEKFPLTTLDALTTSCENMQELLIYARTLHNPKKNSILLFEKQYKNILFITKVITWCKRFCNFY